MRLNKKKIKIILILAILLSTAGFIIFITDFSAGRRPQWGVTFSRSYTLDLGLDWQQTYLAILDDLKINNLRLSAYWDEIEVQPDVYDFSDLDWQINQAADRGVKIILAVGRRLPRWPECHDPQWLKDLSIGDSNDRVLELLTVLVNRYQDNPAIIYWQVENEPLFVWFGNCPIPDRQFLKSEVELVKLLDPPRKIIVTDSGELSSWQGAAKFGDILGTTLYRVVWNKDLGFLDYKFVPPAFYRYKADLTKLLHKNLEDVIIMELQMEPWTFDKNMTELTKAEREKSFDLRRFKDNLGYSQRTGASQIYLWGVEYWYWLKQQGEPEIWQAAKRLWGG